MANSSPIPIIDLFAGPGGLGEGFSSLRNADGTQKFQIKLSVEMDFHAHQTLSLRAFYRSFGTVEAVPPEYYQYLKGREISREDLFAAFPENAKMVEQETRCLELGEDDVSSLVGERVGPEEPWVLIGGPPCQAYSLVGRSRMTGSGRQLEEEEDEAFELRVEEKREKFFNDKRHRLYLEYLKIIGDHWPAVFVMENVKGILSAKVDGERIFPKILQDLQDPSVARSQSGKSYRYRIFSFVTGREFEASDVLEKGSERDFLIRAEEHGLPQARHRVILCGVREDLAPEVIPALEKKMGMTVFEVLKTLPKRAAGVSKPKGMSVSEALAEINSEPWWKEFQDDRENYEISELIFKEVSRQRRGIQRGEFYTNSGSPTDQSWATDNQLAGVLNHETRSHMKEDLWRYLFCSCFAKVHGRSPQLREFPGGLLPNHKNVGEAIKGQKFGDRFRVQVGTKQSTTVVSHISKDGHYFIHPDPSQCRSLTVREAARLQTFPDNYMFEGPRTQQFHQVGNAVPPKLAEQLGRIVLSLVESEPARSVLVRK